MLRTWEPRPLDLVLVDGAHAFPYQTLDWWFLAPHVKIGGQNYMLSSEGLLMPAKKGQKPPDLRYFK